MASLACSITRAGNGPRTPPAEEGLADRDGLSELHGQGAGEAEPGRLREVLGIGGEEQDAHPLLRDHERDHEGGGPARASP